MIQKIDMSLCNQYGLSVSLSDVSETSFSLHTHDFHELVIILKGTGIQEINTEAYSLIAGDVFVLKGSDMHGYRNSKNLLYYNIAYDPRLLAAYDKGIRDLPGYFALFLLEPIFRKQHNFQSKLHLSTKDLIYASELTSLLYKEYTQRVPGFQAMLVNYFIQLVVFLSRKYSEQQSPVTNSFMPLADTIAYIEQNFTSDISLNSLAERSDMSVNHFLRVFRSTFNLTPVNYINQLKIKKACELMVDSGKTMTCIAFESGFSDSNYFSRLFKKIMGMTPTEYRDRAV